MKLIVGLGNPGIQYEQTRHNAGFLAIDTLATRHGGELKEKSAYDAEIAEIMIGEERVLLAKPTTFMNSSGNAVAKLLKSHPIEKNDLLVLYDDADLSLGDVRLKTEGSSAGHNGMQSIIDVLGTNEIDRVRMGIGRPENPNIPLDDFVLGRWSDHETNELPTLLTKTADEAERWAQ